LKPQLQDQEISPFINGRHWRLLQIIPVAVSMRHTGHLCRSIPDTFSTVLWGSCHSPLFYSYYPHQL